MWSLPLGGDEPSLCSCEGGDGGEGSEEAEVTGLEGDRASLRLWQGRVEAWTLLAFSTCGRLCVIPGS